MNPDKDQNVPDSAQAVASNTTLEQTNLENITVLQSSPKELENQDLVQNVIQRDLGDRLGDAHMNILPTKKLIITMLIMSFNVFTAFVDQTAITIALPTLADDLNAEKTINWAATTALLANCVCQVLFGRLVDIFGRKDMLLYSLVVLGISDLACGFAKTGVQFYVFRAFAGIGSGGIQALTIIIISDIVTLKQRGKYQGILGANVGLGNALGPFLMSAFIEHSNWRNFYHLMPCLIAIQLGTTYYFVDNRKENLNSILTKKEKFLNIDYTGILFSTAGLVLILVPLNGGGLLYRWDSVLVIVMFIIGGLCFITFLVIEWRNPKLPMIPLNLFHSILLDVIFASNFLYGLVFFSFQYYIPYYFQIVLGFSELRSATVILSMVLIQAVMSTVAGQLISWSGHYKYIIVVGYGIWFLGVCLLLLFNVNTPTGTIVGVLIVIGSGAGWIFQPSVVAAQAQAKKSERAVVISTRNLSRSFGGALGTAVASLIVTNSLKDQISKALESPNSYKNIPVEYLNYLKSHIYNKIEISGLNQEQILVIKTMYMKSIRNYFYLTIPCIGFCFLGAFLINDRGLQCIDELPSKKSDEKV